MSKSRSLMVDFSIVILCQFPSSVTSYQHEVHQCVYIGKLFYAPLPVCLFKNLFLHVLYLYVVVPLAAKTFISPTVAERFALLFFPGMMSSLAKCKQVFGRALLDIFTTICLFVRSSSIWKWFDYTKESRQAIYFNDKKRCIWSLRFVSYSTQKRVISVVQITVTLIKTHFALHRQPIAEWWGAGMVICLEQSANNLHMVQLMPLPPTAPSTCN